METVKLPKGLTINSNGLVVLPPDAYVLHDYLLTHAQGSGNAKKAIALYDMFGWSPRYVRYLRSLANSQWSPLHHKILTSNNGYYIPTTVESDTAYDNAIHRLTSQALAMLVEASTLRKHRNHDGQGKLKLTPYMKEIVEIAVELQGE